MPFGPSRRIRACLLFIALQLLAVGPALGLDKAKVAEANARRATAALEQGDHEQAARLFHEAFKLDPSRSEYLYGAARETLSAGDATTAEELFQKFLALPGVDVARAARAKEYVGELRATAKSKEADAARARGDGALAASLYREAATLDPSKPAYLLRGARAAQDAGLKTLAVENLNAFLAKAPANDADRPEAQTRLKALTAPPPVEQVAAPPAKSPQPVAAMVAPPASKPSTLVVVAPAQKERPTPWGKWGTVGTGGVIALVGGGVWLSTLGDRSSLVNDVAKTTDGKVSGLTYDQAMARNDSIVNRNIAAAVLGGMGVATAGVGLWLVLTDHEKVAVLPTGNGASFVAAW